MDKLPFKNFTELCRLNLDRKYVPEIYEIITNSDCYFEPGVVGPHDHIASLYKLRLEIAKESGKRDDSYINEFEKTVSNLQDSQSKELGITWLDSDDNGSFLIFYEPDHLNILGVLKAKSISGEGDNSKNMNKGDSPGRQKYSKGELVKPWDYQ